MKKSNSFIRLTGLLFVGGLAIFLISLQASRREEVPLEALLLSHPSFPNSWYTGLETISVEWFTWRTTSQKPRYAYHSESNLGRGWHRFEDDDAEYLSAPSIRQHLYLYNTPFTAARQYLLSRPEIAYRNSWPNFQLSYNKPNRYPSDWPYTSAFADQEHVVCAVGRPDSCQLWIYWARYGQYILKVEFFAPNRGMNAALFAQIVSQIDDYVGQQLEKP